MKLAASNIVFPAIDHLDLLPVLRALGISGLELAPSHTWAVPWNGIKPGMVTAYRRAAEAADLQIIGMHALLAGRPDLGLFETPGMGGQTIGYLTRLSAICRDTGGKTLILGPRWKGRLTEKAAWQRARDFLELLLPRIEDHGTVLCFAPLAPKDGDFCTRARECYMLVNAIDHPSFGLHLSGAALAAAGDRGHATFAAVRGRLDHFHADEPCLAALGSSGQIDHPDLRRHLAAISYPGWISIVQQNSPAANLFGAITRAVQFTTGSYLRAGAH